MSITNTAKKSGFIVRTMRNFIEHRATWMYLLCDEARKKGLDPKTFAPAAIRRCGIFHGMRAQEGASAAEAKSCRLLKKKSFSLKGRMIFEMKILSCTDDAFAVDFHYCPLVEAWKKQGASDAEIDTLCDWAMEGDRGIAEQFGCDLELPKTIARGDGVCQIRFKRKA